VFRNSSTISPQQKIANASNRGRQTITSPLVFCIMAFLFFKKEGFLKDLLNIKDIKNELKKV